MKTKYIFTEEERETLRGAISILQACSRVYVATMGAEYNPITDYAHAAENAIFNILNNSETEKAARK